MKYLKAVVFDLDGTLIDSLPLLVAAKVHVAKTHGLNLPTREDVLGAIRKSGSVQEVISKLWPGEDVDKLLETNKQFVANNSQLSVGYKGLLELMEWLRIQNLCLGVVTGSSSKIEHLLKELGINKYFSSVVHSERVHSHKPDPEGILLALSECKSNPNETIMVGDMVVDIEAGKRAGLKGTIGITHGYDERIKLEAAKTDILVDSLMDLPQAISSLDTPT